MHSHTCIRIRAFAYVHCICTAHSSVRLCAVLGGCLLVGCVPQADVCQGQRCIGLNGRVVAPSVCTRRLEQFGQRADAVVCGDSVLVDLVEG